VKSHLGQYRYSPGFVWLQFRNETEGVFPYPLAVFPLGWKHGLKRRYVFEKRNLKNHDQGRGEMTLEAATCCKGQAEGS